MGSVRALIRNGIVIIIYLYSFIVNTPKFTRVYNILKHIID